MKRVLILLMCILCANTAFSINFKIYKTLASEKSRESIAIVAAADQSGYFVLSGTIPSNAQELHRSKLNITKIDVDGNFIWEKEIIEGFESRFVANQRIVKLPDGGFVFIGSMKPDYDMSQADLVFLKFEPDGNVIVNKRIYLPDTERPSFIVRTTDNGFIIFGTSNKCYDHTTQGKKNCLSVFKVDKEGNYQWSRTFDGYQFESAVSIFGGDIMVAVEKKEKLSLCRMNEFGIIVEEKELTDIGYPEGLIISERLGQYLLTGTKMCEFGNSTGFSKYLFSVVVDFSGKITWNITCDEKILGHSKYVTKTEEGKYFVVGVINENWAGAHRAPETNAFIKHFDVDGKVLWETIFESYEDDKANVIIKAIDEGYVVLGNTKKDGKQLIFLAKVTDRKYQIW